jgi:hypothetical protein
VCGISRDISSYIYNFLQYFKIVRSKARVYGRSFAEIAVSNLAWGMDVCLL